MAERKSDKSLSSSTQVKEDKLASSSDPIIKACERAKLYMHDVKKNPVTRKLLERLANS